jgi:hypothetical protein
MEATMDEQVLLDYLTGLRADPDLNEPTLLAAEQLWAQLKVAKPSVRVPTAWASCLDTVKLYWMRKDATGEVLVYFEAEVFPTGSVEWFCTDRTPGGYDWFHEAPSAQEIPEGALELLKLF